MPRVSCICPTRNRQDKHESPLYSSFAADSFDDRELLVYDDSPAPSPFFSKLRDRRVTYLHGAPLTVGAARNALIARATGSIIANRDDDDEYRDDYISRMTELLLDGDFDLVKLGVWRMRRDSDRTLWRWDTDKCGGMQYAIAGDGTTVGPKLAEADELYCRVARIGWGFCYVHHRALAEKTPYPDSSAGEDHEWLQRCIDSGARVGIIRDGESWVMHLVHDRSPCILFPQEFLGYAPERRAGLGAVEKMVLRPGARYTGTALLKNSHTTKSVQSRLQALDLHPESWDEDWNSGMADYRRIRFVVRAGETAHGEFPMSLPQPMSWVDSSRVENVGVGWAADRVSVVGGRWAHMMR